MAIQYVAYTREGQRVAGTLAVDSEATAEEMLWRSDLIVVSLRQTRPKGGVPSLRLAHVLPTLYRPQPRAVVDFTRELATLLESGIALHTALRVLQSRVNNPLLKEAVKGVTGDIEGGASLSQAVTRYPHIFPSMYSRLITVGEQTGRLDIALHQIATHLEKQATTAQKLRRALVYPAFIAVLGIGAAFFMLTFALPALLELFGEFGAELPLPTRILVAGAGAASQYGVRLLVALGGMGAALAVYFRTPRGAFQRDGLILRLPVVGQVVAMTQMFRFTSTLHTLLGAGLPLTDALDMTARAATNSRVRQAIVQLRQDIMAGQSLSQALAQQPIFPDVMQQMVNVGEESGTLSRNLETLASLYERESDRGIGTLTGMLEPTMILLVGGLVGLVAVSIMSSIYGVIGKIG